MKYALTIILLYSFCIVQAQVPVDLKKFSSKNGAKIQVMDNKIFVSWPVNKTQQGRLVLDLKTNQPLFSSIGLMKGTVVKEICKNLDPVFVVTVGKRDLVSQNGWNIFFDKVPSKPFQSHRVRKIWLIG